MNKIDTLRTDDDSGSSDVPWCTDFLGATTALLTLVGGFVAAWRPRPEGAATIKGARWLRACWRRPRSRGQTTGAAHSASFAERLIVTTRARLTRSTWRQHELRQYYLLERTLIAPANSRVDSRARATAWTPSPRQTLTAMVGSPVVVRTLIAEITDWPYAWRQDDTGADATRSECDVQLVIGAGAVGSATAQLLADRGERVRLVTRSGRGPEHPAIERLAADASDADALSRLADGVAVIYSCAGPAYPRWATDWPPLAAALLRAAETSGALLITTGNLYGYGAVGGPLTEDLPLRPNSEKGRVRVRIWNEALEAHRAGRIHTAEVRSSDYLGAGAVTPMTLLVLPKVLAGRRASAPADLDAPHSWTYVGDVARTLLAVAAEAGSWGRAWHTPTGPPQSFREVATRAAELAGVPAPRVSAMPYPVLWLGGLFNPMARAARETQYQFRKPFVMDSTAATAAFGISPTPLDHALHETIADLRSHS